MSVAGWVVIVGPKHFDLVNPECPSHCHPYYGDDYHGHCGGCGGCDLLSARTYGYGMATLPDLSPLTADHLDSLEVFIDHARERGDGWLGLDEVQVAIDAHRQRGVGATVEVPLTEPSERGDS